MTARLADGWVATWSTLGSLVLDAGGQLVFPDAPDRKGFYRFVVLRGRRPIAAYIGETGRADGLRGRFRHYRRRGIKPLVPPGTTSNNAARFKAAVAHGQTVRVDILGEVATRGETSIAVDASTKAARLQVEGRLVQELRATGIETINK